MTDGDLAKIESQLKVRLPGDYRQLLAARSDELCGLTVHYPWGASPYLSDRLYTDAQRIIDVNRIERQSDSGTGGAFPSWHKQFILIGDDGGGGYYCLRLDNKPGVFMIGSDCGDQPELKAQSLGVYVDDVLAEYPSMSRRYPAPGQSSFDAACEPHERVGIFLDSQEFPGNGRIVYQGDDRNLTLDSLSAVGVNREEIHRNVIKVVAALLQCPPAGIAVNSYTEEGDPALKLDVTGMPMQLNGRPYWYASLQVYGKNAEIVFHGFVEEIPPKIALEWRNLTVPLVALIKAAYPGAAKISGSPAKPPIRRGDRLIYTLAFDLKNRWASHNFNGFMNFLAIETSCDETAVAVFTDDLRILANVVASQVDLHARFGGVVPEVAARAHLQRLLPTLDEALKQANLKLADIGAVVVMNSPGLVGALLVGVSAAKMLALTLEVPLLAANHIEAHIYAARLAAGREIFPCVGLVVSGGHTSLFQCETPLDFNLLGGTIDDAAGEAFDKVAAILGLGFPGGPAVEREAAAGDPKAYPLPRSFLKDDRLEFSFSGLKTAVLYALHGPSTTRGPLPGPGSVRANLAASFQQAVIDVLVAKCRQALRRTNEKRLAVGGGVSANRSLRASLEAMAQREDVELFIPPMDLCTDNAAMAAVAVEKWRRQEFAPFDLDAVPTYQGKN